MSDINLHCDDCHFSETPYNKEPCYDCHDHNRFVKRVENKPQPLLTKNEYLALELTKAYVGQDMKPITAAIIAEKYEYFLGRFNKETET